MTPTIPVSENPLPDDFRDWSREEQEEYISDMTIGDITELLAYHTETELELFQEEPTENQLKQVIRQWLEVGIIEREEVVKHGN